MNTRAETSNGAPRFPADTRPVLITGGCGFIGTNLASRLLERGCAVLLYDNLSRAGVKRNLRWLTETYGNLVQVEIGDTRDRAALNAAVGRASAVFHFAAQVAVTTSLAGPLDDFSVNAQGSLNVLEAIRAADAPIPIVFTSTNKVYGSLNEMPLLERETRYEPADTALRNRGVNECRSLDFHSPYGCSKGSADQYVLDYARSYGLPTAVFRMSCIYGTHQFGNEDQGWVAHFLIRALEGKPLTIYGDGKQVRDILFADDLVNALLLAQANIKTLAGQAFNIGGGPGRTISLLELIQIIERLRGEKLKLTYEKWRTGDQRYYVSDTEKFRLATGWQPQVSIRDGIERLYHWLRESLRLNAASANASASRRIKPAAHAPASSSATREIVL
jgi:CDP-paratose 2-epimerase